MATVPIPKDSLLGVLRNLDRRELVRELRSIDAQRRELDTYEQLVRLVLDLAHGPTANGAAPAPADADETDAEEVQSERPSTLRGAVMAVMAQEPSRIWRPADVLHRLTELGWAPLGKNARNQVQNRFSDMLSRGEVSRVGAGQYQLAASYQEAAQLHLRNDESE